MIKLVTLVTALSTVSAQAGMTQLELWPEDETDRKFMTLVYFLAVFLIIVFILAIFSFLADYCCCCCPKFCEETPKP